MKIRFTESEIIVIDEMNNSLVIDKDTIKRVFNLKDRDENPTQQKVLEIIKNSSLHTHSQEGEEVLIKDTNTDDDEKADIPVSVALRYTPPQNRNMQKHGSFMKMDMLKSYGDDNFKKYVEELYQSAFNGKIEVPDILPSKIGLRLVKYFDKYEMTNKDKFGKNIGLAIRSIRNTSPWRKYQQDVRGAIASNDSDKLSRLGL